MNTQNNTPHSEFQNSESTLTKLKLSELCIFVFSEFPRHYARTLKQDVLTFKNKIASRSTIDMIFLKQFF